MRNNWPIYGAILFFCISLNFGCDRGPVDETARRELAQQSLRQMRKLVDLNGPELPNIRVGEKATKTIGVDIEGEKIDLDDHQGQVILLSFWGGAG